MPQNRDERLREIIDKYARMYMKLAFECGVPYGDVEDVVMEAFWEYHKHKYDEAEGESDEESEKILKALLTKIVCRKCYDYKRKNGKFKTLSLDENVDEFGVVSYFRRENPMDIVIADEKYMEIRNRIDEMKDIWRVPAIMYFVEEYSISEICEALNISGTVCRSRISRARSCLRKILKDYL